MVDHVARCSGEIGVRMDLGERSRHAIQYTTITTQSTTNSPQIHHKNTTAAHHIF
jgi:hypothetical protein